MQKSFWSCTHVNSFQNYTLYINLHILFIFIQDNFKYPRIKKIHQTIEKITRIDQKHQSSLCLVITRIVAYKNLLHINLHILFIIYFKTNLNIQNDVNPTSTSGDTCKTIFIILFKLFSIGDSFKFNATRET